mmetsp:Transcript_31104/g.60030  ORF Transcript_31104/g.60030 Transcript_31104/m.60030 type:complete len:224 (+) Transcript_31104:682-1353(+)
MHGSDHWQTGPCRDYGNILRKIHLCPALVLHECVHELHLDYMIVGGARQDVVTVSSKDRAVLGFRKLWMGGKWFDWSLSALPVVDAKGELVGNLSGSDMRNMTKDNLDDLLLSVEDFLWKINGKSKMRTPVTVTLDTPFLEAIEKIMGNSVHRLWVTGTGKGDKNKVKGVLSLTDIIYKFSTFDLSRHPMRDITERLARGVVLSDEYAEYKAAAPPGTSTGPY